MAWICTWRVQVLSDVHWDVLVPHKAILKAVRGKDQGPIHMYPEGTLSAVLGDVKIVRIPLYHQALESAIETAAPSMVNLSHQLVHIRYEGHNDKVIHVLHNARHDTPQHVRDAVMH